jgi:cobalt-zinc-cadmium efflux system membrane fusion protein
MSIARRGDGGARLSVPPSVLDPVGKIDKMNGSVSEAVGVRVACVGAMLRACLLATAALLAGGCTPSRAATLPTTPPGEVWLRADEIAAGDIVDAPVELHAIDDVLVASGRVAFDEERVGHVSSPVSGRVVRIDGALGEHVRKGQVLALIRSPDLGDATSELAKAEAELIATEHTYRRTQTLREGGGASEANVEQTQDAWRIARAETERAQEKVALLHAGRGVTESYALTSPIDGTVLARNVSPGFEIQGAYVGGAQPELFTVGDVDDVWVFADIYESDLARVHAGQRVDVSVMSVPRPFEGKIDYVANMLDPQTRTARLRCTIKNPSHLLEPEMLGTVRVSVAPLQALAVPRGAILHLAGQSLVFVDQGPAPDGRTRFERLPIVADESGDAPFVPVEHGLESGQKVVAKGANGLSMRL